MTEASSIAETASRVRSGELDPTSLVTEAVARMVADNPRLNAIVADRASDAISEAASLPATPLINGALAGIPFTAKDMLATRDLPTTCGSRTLRDHRTSHDATAVARMRDAGAVLVGKTNCPEFALGVDTDNDLFGATRNPLGPWTAGGSSGGEAAAVAAGMSMVGLGSDYGGSLRWPAQCAGLVGLRPSVGRVPRTGEQPGDDFRDEVGRSFQDTVQVVGPIGRTVADVHTVLQVISGPDGHDPLVSNAPLLDFRDVELDQLELAWAPTVAGVRVDDEITSAVESAVNVLRRLGATIVHGVPDAVNDGLRVYDRLRAAEPMTAVARLHHRHPELVGDAIKSMLRSRVLLSGSELTDLWAERDHLISALAEWLKGRRALILPVSTGAPRDLTGHVADFHLLSPSRAISLFGVPAASVPVAVSTHGSPISVQVVAPAFREDVALAVCAHLSEQFKHAPVDWTEATGAR